MRDRRTTNRKREYKTLVLGADMRMLLPIARSLGRAGVEVHAAWCAADNPALRSRYIACRHELPEPTRQDSVWKHRLNALIQREQYDLVLPTTDLSLHALQTHRRDFAAHRCVCLLSEACYDVVRDKQRTAELARSLGIPTPTTWSHESELPPDITFPLVVKPTEPVPASGRGGKNFVQIVRDRKELQSCLDDLRNGGADAVVQEHLGGRGVGVELLAKAGRVLVAFQHQRLHETRGHGSTYRQAVSVSTELLDAAERIISALDYTGVAMVEFRVDPERGRFGLIEINGRFWGSLPLAVAAGVDFPRYLYDLWTAGRREFAPQPRIGLRCRHLTYDLRWMWRAFRGKYDDANRQNEGSAGWSVNRISGTAFLGDLLRFVFCRDGVDSFAWDDPAPFLAECGQLVRAAAAKAVSPLNRRRAKGGRQRADGGKSSNAALLRRSRPPVIK